MANFLVGDVARISVAILDVVGTPADPTELVLTIKSPEGVTSTPAPVKDSTGNYHFDLSLDLPGSYGFRWQSQGANKGVVEGGIYVNASQFGA